MLPEDLFPESLYKLKIPQQNYIEIDSERVLSLQEAAEHKLLPSYEIDIESIDLRYRLERVLNSLTPREEKIIRMRYGFDDGEEKTFETVAREFRISRERVMQIERKVLRKLRHSSIAKLIR